MAVARRLSSIVSALLDASADLHARNGDGLTPVQLARSLDHGDMVGLLLDAGARDVGADADEDITPPIQ